MCGEMLIALHALERSATRSAMRIIRSVAYVIAVLTSVTSFAFSQTRDAAAPAATFVSAAPAGVQPNWFNRGTELRQLSLAPDRPNERLVHVTAFAPGLLRSPLQGSPEATRATWWAPVASALVPGSGQALLRQQRSLAYLVAEVFMVIQASRVQSDFEDARKRYRNIAADVARLPFGTDRPVGPWEYYETLASPTVTASGSYDLAIGGKFTPEPDEATFNGRQWLLARELYWASPVERPAENSAEYQKALSFYQSRAVQGSFRWSWRDNQNAKELYVQTIKEANHSKQQGVSMVGLVAANHLLSLVDAYIAVRMRRYGGAGIVNASINSELRPTGIPGEHSIAVAMNVSLPIPGSGYRR